MRKISLWILPSLIYFLMVMFWKSYRKNFHYLDDECNDNALLVGWHSELFVSLLVYQGLKLKGEKFSIVSQHHDGEILTKLLTKLSITAIRGSSARGARGALMNAIKILKAHHNISFTPDGPKGPRYTLSDGVVALAIKFRLPIVVVNYKPQSYWQLRSWDKFVVPKPFSTVDIYYQVVHLYDMELDEAKSYLRQRMLEYALA